MTTAAARPSRPSQHSSQLKSAEMAAKLGAVLPDPSKSAASASQPFFWDGGLEASRTGNADMDWSL